MADFNLPGLTDSYSNVLAYLKNRDADLMMGLDPATTTPSNVPNNAIRWNSAGNKWEKLVSGAWQALASRYAIDVTTLMSYAPGNASGNIPLSNGTVNTNLSADMVDGYHAGTGANQVLTLDGTGKVPAANLPASGVTAGTYRSVTVGTDGRVTGGTNPTTLAGYGITDAAAIGGSSGQNFAMNTGTYYGSIKSQYFTGSVNVAVAGDLAAVRSGGAVGVVYLSADGVKQINWDGTYYNLPAADLKINNNVAWHGGNFNPANYATLANFGASNVTVTNDNGRQGPAQLRLAQQAANALMSLTLLPNGTSNASNVRFYNSGDANNVGTLVVGVTGAQGSLSSGVFGTGIQPTNFAFSNLRLLVNTSSDDGITALQVSGTASASNATASNHLVNMGQADGRYLGITAQAADSAKLGGQVASYYAPASTTVSHSQQYGFHNRIINGNFVHNQRGYGTGTALAAGAYGHDRWKAGTGGCTYTFTQSKPDTQITITAGTLQQIIEDANVEGGTYTLSWTGTAQARVNSGSYAASPLTVTGLAAGANVTIEFNAGTLGTVQFEPGSVASAFQRRPVSVELQLCQRYFFQLVSSVPMQSYGGGASSNAYVLIIFPVTMRIPPTATNNWSNGTRNQSQTVDNLTATSVMLHLVSNASGDYAVTYNANNSFSAEL